MTLSVIVPVYNEEKRVERALARLLECDFVEEIIVVDDGSTDNSRKLIEDFLVTSPKLRLAIHEYNKGKGKAIRTALEHCTKEVIAIHDSDLEYDPADIEKLFQQIQLGKADVVYGSRFLGSQPRRTLFYWHYLGNKFLTTICNMASDLNLTDIETCHKVFRRSLVSRIKLQENRFGIEPELTIKFARAGAIIYEVGISYEGRTYKDGKKIGWKDGFSAIYCILKYSTSPKKFWLKVG